MVERGHAAQFDASINVAIEIGVSEQVSVVTIGVERRKLRTIGEVADIMLCIYKGLIVRPFVGAVALEGILVVGVGASNERLAVRPLLSNEIHIARGPVKVPDPCRRR